jgi:hypothetical protein
MAQATRDSTTSHPPHLEIWEHPETAPKIVKLDNVSWLGHCMIHITTALNGLPPAARGTFIKDLTDFLRRQGQDVARRERDKAKRS